MGASIPMPDDQIPDRPQPTALEKFDAVTWKGLDSINDVMDFANMMHRPDILESDKQRIREQLQNIVDHIRAFIEVK
jgi:hypothetical protein